jgi:MFS family permease
MQDSGHAAGALLAAAAPPLLAAALPEGAAEAPLRASLAAYAPLVLVAAVPYLFLSRGLAAPPPRPRARLSPEGRRILTRVCALFGLDGLGGGFLATSLMTWFLHERFGAGATEIGVLAAAGSALNALSHLGAAWLAERIGLVRTMVFTHIPSSVLLATVPFAPSFAVAAVLFLLREGLVEMDVPTRQSYVMAVLRPEERTFAAGATLLVRLFAYVVGPLVAAPFLASGDPDALAVPLWIGAGTKILYDVLLWRSFRRLAPPEEEPARSAPE